MVPVNPALPLYQAQMYRNYRIPVPIPKTTTAPAAAAGPRNPIPCRLAALFADVAVEEDAPVVEATGEATTWIPATTDVAAGVYDVLEN